MKGKRYGLMAVVAAITLAGGTVAYANIPDATGVIHGCYKKTSPNQRSSTSRSGFGGTGAGRPAPAGVRMRNPLLAPQGEGNYAPCTARIA